MSFEKATPSAMAAALSGAQQTASAPIHQHQTGGQPVKRSLRSLLASSSTIMSSNAGSATLNGLKKSVDDLLAGLDKTRITVGTIAMDNGQPGSAYYSGLLIAVSLASSKGVVAYHYFMLAGSRELPEARINTENNTRYDVQPVAGQLYDAKMVERLLEQLKGSFPGTTALLNTGCTVIPASFDYTNMDGVRRITASALNACGTEIGVRTNTTDAITFDRSEVELDMVPEILVNIAKLDPNGASVITDATGAPIRTDVNLVAQLRAKNSNVNASRNDVADRSIAAKVSGYVDVLYYKDQQQQQPYGFGMTSQQMPHCFMPAYIVTDVGSEIGFNDQTMLLAVDSVLALSENRSWMQAFMPTPTQLAGSKKNKIDTRNIGALNLIANVPVQGKEQGQWGQSLSLADPGFTSERLAAYMNAIFNPNGFFNVAIDCPVNGAQSWIFNTINDAATGNPAAMNRLLDAANKLTGGAFFQFFDSKNHKVFTMSEVILAGTYIDVNGMPRDLRDVDLVWASSIFETDPSQIFSYLRTFNAYDKGQHSLDFRLHGRRKMLMAMTSDSAKITGHIYRHFFSSQFLLALRQALASQGYTPAIVNSITTSDFAQTRVSADFVSGGLAMGMGAQNLFGTNGITPGFGNILNSSFRSY